jgi:5-methylcytosine-specific restriction enzyme subunit McrC
MHLETLEENREQVLALSDSQALALQTAGGSLASNKWWWGEDPEAIEKGSVIACLPHSTGHWRVVVRNAVGIISIGDLQIAVQPKIPTDHLLHLFSRSGQLPRLDDQRAYAAENENLWALVARWYVDAAERLLRRDLIRDYLDVHDTLTVIRGRTDPAAAVSAVYRGRLEFPCEFDEFATDTPLNRLLKAAAASIAASSLLGWPLRRRALAIVARMEDVGIYRFGDERARLDRRTSHYQDAVTLGRQVLLNQGRALAHGDAIAWTFLIPTPAAVEEGLRQALQTQLGAKWDIRKKGVQLSGSTLTFNPDLVFEGGLAVGDVKYKVLGNDWHRGDLYQAIAFATAYRTRHACLIGFRTPGSNSLGALNVGDAVIEELPWDADASLEPGDAEVAFTRSVERWLDRVLEVVPLAAA